MCNARPLKHTHTHTRMGTETNVGFRTVPPLFVRIVSQYVK